MPYTNTIFIFTISREEVLYGNVTEGIEETKQIFLDRIGSLSYNTDNCYYSDLKLIGIFTFLNLIRFLTKLLTI